MSGPCATPGMRERALLVPDACQQGKRHTRILPLRFAQASMRPLVLQGGSPRAWARVSHLQQHRYRGV